MKIFMTVMMMVAMTSAFAGECKLNEACSDEASCKALGKDNIFENGKCNKNKESNTACSDIVSSTAAKPSTDGSASVVAPGTSKTK